MSQKKFTNATGNWTVGQNDEINYAGKAKLEGAIQAADFLDDDGNPIHTDSKGNIFIGENALYFRGGYYNIAIGKWALINNAEGRENTAVGYRALQGNETGWRNTGVGESANGAIPDGMDCTAVGHSALVTAPVGSKELTGIGSRTGCPNPFGAAIENSTAIGFNAQIDVSNKIQLGNEQVTLVHTHGSIQATDFLDADGKSIVGGGAEAIEATFYESVEILPLAEDTGGTLRDYRNYWVVDDNNGVGEPTRTNIYSNGRIEANDLDAYSYRGVEFRTTTKYGKFQGVHAFFRDTWTVENTVFGGINIVGADAERPEDLPYSPDEKSVQYALTVTHETLGRTVEIDKEGIIRARQFTDMDGNPIGGGAELPDGTGTGSILTWQNNEWKSSDRFRFEEGPTNEIVANRFGIILAATDAETKLDIDFDGFHFTHGYQPARVYIKKNPYESDPSQLFVDEVRANDYLDADGNQLMRTLTQAEYDALTPNANTVYFIT